MGIVPINSCNLTEEDSPINRTRGKKYENIGQFTIRFHNGRKYNPYHLHKYLCKAEK